MPFFWIFHFYSFDNRFKISGRKIYQCIKKNKKTLLYNQYVLLCSESRINVLNGISIKLFLFCLLVIIINQHSVCSINYFETLNQCNTIYHTNCSYYKGYITYVSLKNNIKRFETQFVGYVLCILEKSSQWN